MKKMLAALLAALMVLSLAACGASTAPAATTAPAAAAGFFPCLDRAAQHTKASRHVAPTRHTSCVRAS